jgi:hypothetical protein
MVRVLLYKKVSPGPVKNFYMTPSAVAITLLTKIEELRKAAEEAKASLDFELAFILIDQADALQQEMLGHPIE